MGPASPRRLAFGGGTGHNGERRLPRSNNKGGSRGAAPFHTVAAPQQLYARRPLYNHSRKCCRPAPRPEATTSTVVAWQHHQGQRPRPQRNDECSSRSTTTSVAAVAQKHV